MKRYEQMTHEELIALTEDEIRLLVDREIAESGIMPAECPKPPDLENLNISKTEVGYEVGGLIFQNKDDAETVAGMPLLQKKYNYSWGYDYEWFDPLIDPAVSQVAVYKQSDVARVRDAVAENKRKKADYAPAKHDYDNFCGKTSAIRNRVWSCVGEAKAFQRRIDLAKKTWEKHLTLADGDEQLASRFFVDAFWDDPDIIDRVVPEDYLETAKNEVELKRAHPNDPPVAAPLF